MSQNVHTAKQCPNGHTLDPNWTSCPYCEAQERSKQKTVGPTISSDDHGTRIDAPPRFEEKRTTKVMQSGESTEPGRRSGQADNRKIVGALVTYTWNKSGHIYPVREGKNYIGRGSTVEDPSHQAYEIQIPIDEKMSGEHALILCRAGNYEIIDQMSSNGTFLDGVMLKSNQSAELKNYAEIRTGATIWTFVQLHKSKLSQDEPVHYRREEIIEERIIKETVQEDDDRETKVK